tara:strand:+ start:484 stop:798 length:315 start_codon:yes stop_codon:yes gene_type:complete
MEDGDYSEEYKANFIKLAAKLSGYIKSKSGYLLQPVRIRGNGKGFYWSISDKIFIWVDRNLEWYHVDGVAPDDRGRLCLYSPFIFASGVICRVPEEEVEFVGFN